MGPKPVFKKGRMVNLKRALPGAPANTPMLVLGILRGKKRDNYMHRYECVDNHGTHYFVYESDLG